MTCKLYIEFNSFFFVQTNSRIRIQTKKKKHKLESCFISLLLSFVLESNF